MQNHFKQCPECFNSEPSSAAYCSLCAAPLNEQNQPLTFLDELLRHRNTIVITGLATTCGFLIVIMLAFSKNPVADDLQQNSQSASPQTSVSKLPTNKQEDTIGNTTIPPAPSVSKQKTPIPSPQVTPAKPPETSESKCDPNYSGCVPIASDVDCASGSGDGPVYVEGPIRVIGYDKYRLDKDGDGIACEN